MTLSEPLKFIAKVPAITALFWLIKVLSTTVGETFADYLNTLFADVFGFGEVTAFSVVTAISVLTLAALLVAQLSAPAYRRWLYWPAIVFVSIVGTLVTDGLHDLLGVELWVTTVAFGVMLGAVLLLWFPSEKTLAMKSIVSPRQEVFYWTAVLATFALGTSAGDQLAESVGLGYGISLAIFVSSVVLIAVAWRIRIVGPVLSFWFAYVLTRPLGASLGDLLSQDTSAGGLGLGTGMTSVAFLAAIVLSITYLSVKKTDVLEGGGH